MRLKDHIFSLLPKFIQRKVIMGKTGFLLVKEASLTQDLKSDIYIPPKQSLWIDRISSPYGHEPQVVKWYERNLKEDDVVFDVGANFGYFGILTTLLKPTVRFHGFEGNWFVTYYQRLNRRHLGKEKNWKINEVMVGDHRGGGFIRIDDYVSNHEFPTIFQMDVDGEEINVLNGALELLKSGKTTFLVEVHPVDLANRGKTVQQFLGLFDPALYSFRYLPDLRSPESEWSEVITPLQLEDEFYLLATPRRTHRY